MSNGNKKSHVVMERAETLQDHKSFSNYWFYHLGLLALSIPEMKLIISISKAFYEEKIYTISSN